MEGLFKTSTGELFEKVSKKRVVVAADWACRGPHLEAVQRDPEGVYGDLLPHLRAADLAIVNVETTLSEKGAPILKAGPNISCPADCVKGLTQVPFHIACLANNHTRDFDDEGLIQTIEDQGLQVWTLKGSKSNWPSSRKLQILLSSSSTLAGNMCRRRLPISKLLTGEWCVQVQIWWLPTIPMCSRE